MVTGRSKLTAATLVLIGIVCLGISSCATRKLDIPLQNRTIESDARISPDIIQTAQRSTTAPVHGMVRLKKPLTLDEHRTLHAAGIQLTEYLGNNTHIVTIPAKTDLTSKEITRFVAWADLLQPADKISPRLSRRPREDWILEPESKRLKLLVRFFDGVSPPSASQALQAVGLSGRRYGANNSWAVLADESKIQDLAALPEVRSVAPGPMPFLPLNDGGRRVANTDEAQQATFNTPQPAFRNRSGAGINVGICDTGVDELHDDFSVLNNAGQPNGDRVYNDRVGSGSHGTHVASIATGNGFNSANNGLPAFLLRGHAPLALVGDYPQFGADADDYYDAIVNDGTHVTNHSYVQSMTVYDDEAESIDTIIRGDGTDANGNAVPAAPQVWAAGNNGVSEQYGNEDGYYSLFTSAKNSISVGSVDTGDTRLSNFSSLGPTFDGRIKPDIVAPGCMNSIGGSVGIEAADNGTQGYTGMCGTSMAAPVVTGVIALMMEEFEAVTGGTAAGVLPSTYKAILVNTAVDLEKTADYDTRDFDNPDTGDPLRYHAGPDYVTGWGLVDADAARQCIGVTNRWTERTLATTTALHLFCISVPAGTGEFRVTIAWDDEPGSTLTPETTAKLVNDLDLVLIAPDGTTYLPWTLDPLPLTANPGDGAQDPITASDIVPARRDVDRRNNVEMVTVCRPMAGTWKARIRAFGLPNGNAQPYSFVSSRVISTLCWDVGVIDICQRYPWLCSGVDICARYPWICEPIYDFPWIVVDDDIFEFDPRQPVPIDEICKYVIDCPGCEGQGWNYCPGIEFQMDMVPPEVIVNIFDDRGNIIQIADATSPTRSIKIAKHLPGERYFMAFSDRKGEPFDKPIRARLKLGH